MCRVCFLETDDVGSARREADLAADRARVAGRSNGGKEGPVGKATNRVQVVDRSLHRRESDVNAIRVVAGARQAVEDVLVRREHLRRGRGAAGAAVGPDKRNDVDLRRVGDFQRARRDTRYRCPWPSRRATGSRGHACAPAARERFRPRRRLAPPPICPRRRLVPPSPSPRTAPWRLQAAGIASTATQRAAASLVAGPPNMRLSTGWTTSSDSLAHHEGIAPRGRVPCPPASGRSHAARALVRCDRPRAAWLVERVRLALLRRLRTLCAEAKVPAVVPHSLRGLHATLRRASARPATRSRRRSVTRASS